MDNKQYLLELKEFYKKELDQTLNFWATKSFDTVNGGFFTCLSRDGSVYDTDKAVWAQGRGAWIFAKAYNDIEKNPKYLEISEKSFNFIKNHCYDKDGRMFFTVTGEGTPIQKRRYWFSESFAVIAAAELYKATGKKEYLDICRSTLNTLLDVKEGRIKTQPKFNPEVVNCIANADPMILINTCYILRDIDVEKKDYYQEVIDRNIEEIKLHYHPEIRALLENVNKDGSLAKGSRGRLVNPGHSIEASWFLMNEATYGGKVKDDILEMGLNILDWSFDWGWDKDVGGIKYFIDVENKPVQALEWDMKLWWPHCETLISFLLAYKHTNNDHYLEMYKKVHDYTFSHFKDEKYGEWYGYLHRDGTVSTDLKGNIFKGPFHIPRLEIMNYLLLQELTK